MLRDKQVIHSPSRRQSDGYCHAKSLGRRKALTNSLHSVSEGMRERKLQIVPAGEESYLNIIVPGINRACLMI